MGYRVVDARTGGEAIAIGHRLGGEIDCALLDIGLPDMGALYVYRGFKEAQPGLTVLLSTSAPTPKVPRHIPAAGAQGFIQKPYSLTALSEKLKELLA